MIEKTKNIFYKISRFRIISSKKTVNTQQNISRHAYLQRVYDHVFQPDYKVWHVSFLKSLKAFLYSIINVIIFSPKF